MSLIAAAGCSRPPRTWLCSWCKRAPACPADTVALPRPVACRMCASCHPAQPCLAGYAAPCPALPLASGLVPNLRTGRRWRERAAAACPLPWTHVPPAAHAQVLTRLHGYLNAPATYYQYHELQYQSSVA